MEIYDVRSIVEYLNTNFPYMALDERELSPKPSSDRVMEIYRMMVADFMGIDQARLEMAPFDDQAPAGSHRVTNNPEEFGDGVKRINLCLTMSSLITESPHMHDFNIGISDITRPEYKRTLTLISFLIMMREVKEEKKCNIEAIIAERNKRIQNLETKKASLVAMKEKIAAAEREKTKREEEMKPIKDRHDALFKLQKEKNNETSEWEKRMKDNAEKLVSKQQENDARLEQLEGIRQEVSKLEMKCVRNPQKLVEEMEALQLQLKEYQNRRVTLGKTFNELTDQKNRFLDAGGLLTDVNGYFNQKLQSGLDEISQLQKQRKDKEEERAQLLVKMDELTASHVRLKTRYEHLLGQKSKKEKQLAKSLTTAKVQLKTLEKEQEQAAADHAHLQQEEKEINDEIEKIEQTIRIDRKDAEEFILGLQQQYDAELTSILDIADGK